MPTARLRFALLLTLAFATLLAFSQLHHELWRDEWRAWLLVREAHSLPDLRTTTLYDGHPLGWYLLLYPLTRITPNPWPMQALHSLFAAAAVFLIALRSPFKKWEVSLLTTGYYFLFEYAVINRNYAPGLFAFFLALSAFPCATRKQTLLFHLALAFAIQCSVYSAVVAVALLLARLVTSPTRPHLPRPRLLPYLLLPAGSALLSLYAIHPGPAPIMSAIWTDLPLYTRLLQTLATPFLAFVPIPNLQSHWWNSNLIVPHLGLRPTIALSLLLLFYSLLLFSRHRAALILLLATYALLLTASLFFFRGDLRHLGHLYIALLAAWWLSTLPASPPMAPPTSPSKHSAPSTPHFLLRPTTLLHPLLLIQAISGIGAVYAHFRVQFSASRQVADYIQANHPNLPVVAYPDYSTSPIAAHLNHPIYFANTNLTGFVNTQDPALIAYPPPLSPLCAYALNKGPILAIIDRRYNSLLPGTPDADITFVDRTLQFHRLADFNNAILFDESYRLFLITPIPPAPTPPTPSPPPTNRP